MSQCVFFGFCPVYPPLPHPLMSKIVLFENVHPSARAYFEAAGLTDITTYKASLPRDELRRAIAGAQVVGIRSRTQLDASVFTDNPANQVDVDAAMTQGVPVFNAPFSNTRSVAELVLAEAMLLLRRVPEKNARVHQGHWDKSADGAFEARGKTLGIIGYGKIGSQVGTLAELIGMKVVYLDVEAKLQLGNARAAASLDALLAQADVVTLHVPGGRGTENLIDSRALAAMKRGAILINASRGTVVDIAALHAALQSGQLGGAALDVFPKEPKSSDEPLDSPLRGMDNVILTPHIGAGTQEAQENIGREVAEKLVQFVQTGATKGAVNFPELPYQEADGTVRILHVHRNLPGALGTLDSLLADQGLNIVSQQLQTRGAIGYALTDVDGTVSDAVLAALRAHPMTVRCDLL